jgi:hypothetical protein
MTTLTAFVLDGYDIRLRPAPHERDWMDATHQRYAYRCLPLNIANAHGWEILCPAGFSAVWDGGPGRDSVRVLEGGEAASVVSHFGSGTLTFHVPCLFRTDPGYDLYVSGPTNRPKDGVAPLTGVIETDWAPYSFTMNWMITRPDTPIRFDEGEPICLLFPVARGALEAVKPELRTLSDAPDLKEQFDIWSRGRTEFNRDLGAPGSEAQRERWQKLYFRGERPDGREGASDHRSRLRLANFSKPRG